MVKLVALKTRTFGLRLVRAGQTFYAPRRYARIWKALGLAADPMPTEELLAYAEAPTPGASGTPPASTQAPETPKAEKPDLDTRTKAELLEIAAAEGIEVAKRATKAEIIAAITAHWAIANGE